MSKSEIEVFQKLTLVSAGPKPDRIRASLVKHQTSDWIHDAGTEAKIPENSAKDKEIILFRHVGSTLPRALLGLMRSEGGYSVANILPTDKDRLSIPEYNSLLRNFILRVARPAQKALGFESSLTPPVREVDHFIPEAAAGALRAFSNLADKSTSILNFDDAMRWRKFLISVHKQDQHLDPEILKTWLVEKGGWKEDFARELAVNYDHGLSAFREFDRFSRASHHGI